MVELENILNMINLDGLFVGGGLVLGILICLFGLKFQKLVLAIAGLVVGFALGNIIVNTFSITDPSLCIVIRFGLALVVSACSTTLFESLLSIVVGIGIFVLVTDMIGTMWYSYLIGIIVGIIGGGLVGKYCKLGVVLFTTFAGAYLVTKGVQGYFNYSYMVIFGVVFIASVLFQCITNKIKL